MVVTNRAQSFSRVVYRIKQLSLALPMKRLPNVHERCAVDEHMFVLTQMISKLGWLGK